MAGPARNGEVHIGLLFHSFESENLGVGAFTVANSAMIGDAIERHGGTPVFHVIGARGSLDYRSTCRWVNDFTNIGTKALANPASDLHRVIRRCDAFFDIGGGDSFSDIYPASRYSRIVAAKVLAAMTGNPLILSPQTIGPFTTWWGKLGARIALRGADKVFARDEMSFTALADLGFADRSVLTTDLAFALPYDAAPKRPSEALTENLIVGLNVSGLLFDLAGKGTGRVKLAVDYQHLIRRMIEALLADPRVAQVHLVPHVSAPHLPIDDDGAIADLLAQEYPALVRVPDFASPSAAKSHIAGLDLLLGARMHATIAALSSDTAVLPMAYSRKFNGLFGSLDYPYIADLVNCGEDDAMRQLMGMLDDLPAAARAAQGANAIARQKLQKYVDFIDGFARDLLQR